MVILFQAITVTGCTPSCDQVHWDGMPLSANSSEAMCSVANVAGKTEQEVTVYASDYMDMQGVGQNLQVRWCLTHGSMGGIIHLIHGKVRHKC